LLQQGLLKSAVNIIECQQLRKVTDPQHPFRHHASIPIRAGNLVLGNLNLVTPPDRVFTENELRMFNAIGDQVGVAVERMRLLEQVKAQRIEEQAALLKLSQALLVESKPQAIMETVVHMTASMLNVEFAALALVDPVEQTFSGRAAIGWPPEVLRQAQRIPLTASTGLAYAIRSRAPVVIPDESRETRFGTPPWVAEMGFASSLLVPIIVNGEIIGGLVINSRSARNWTDDEIRLLSLIANQTAIAIDNTRLFESLVNEQHNTAQLYHLSLELAANLKPDDVAKRALLAALETVGASRGNILTLEEDGERLRLLAVTGYDRETAEALNQRLDWDVSQGVTGRVVRTCKATIVPDVSRDADWVPISGLDDWVQSMLSVPLVAGDRIVGVLNLLSEQLDFFKIKNLSLLTTIASPVALSLQNARLYESLRQRLAELEILADTSSALRKAQSHDDIPPILLAKAVEGLKANAGVLLLLDNDELKFVATHGATGVSKGGVCPPGAGMMWQALESDKPIFIPDVTQIEELQKNVLCQALMGDALSCACVLLRTAASTIGVVYLNWKKKSFFSADESRLLESLAEIAANAIHRSTLHEQTARQALDLTQAYDATIEGWSHALDLRDRETEGHTQRVTDLTLKLARAMEIGEPEIAHIRRGALLHDIGKMGIPDNILRKPGALNEDEWAVMRQHPQFAHEMLSPIDYLQPALDIPWCHHEKWDGSGYPRGLKGEEIPLTARIFAVVDVFDALTSDRPYRPAWTKRKVIAYIRQQAGIHFDPKVVETFLKMIGKK
jgi:HD-GYP domain-containing protein (c-di-GMP phosphodiesterase class II)